MISKVFGLALLVACSQGVHNDHHNAPTSFASFNDNHNTVQHIQSAPQLHSQSKYVPQLHSASYNTAPAPVQYGAPSHFVKAAPSHFVNAAPSVSPSSYYNSPAKQIASVPQKVTPIFQKATPSQSYHQSSSFSTLNLSPSSQYSAPAAHNSVQFAPVSHQISPVSIKTAPVAPISHQVVPAMRTAPAIYAHAAPAHHEEQYPPAQYEFSYAVNDHHTGDIHSHKEVRKGDNTQGEYSLVEADGTIRTVKYTVEGHSGFNAVVERSGSAHQAQAHQVQAHQAQAYQAQAHQVQIHQAQAYQPTQVLAVAPRQQYHH